MASTNITIVQRSMAFTVHVKQKNKREESKPVALCMMVDV